MRACARGVSRTESGVDETETTVHGVRNELERLLSNIELSALGDVVLLLEHVLDVATTLHQALDDLGKVAVDAAGGGRGGHVARLTDRPVADRREAAGEERTQG